MAEWLIAVLSIWMMLLLTAWLFKDKGKIIERVIEQPKLPPIDVQVLNARIIQPEDVLLFRVTSKENLSATEMLSLKTATEEFLTAHGIPNEVCYLNNCELEIARTRII